jgi:hypothetical protein
LIDGGMVAGLNGRYYAATAYFLLEDYLCRDAATR